MKRCEAAAQWPMGLLPTDKERAARYMALAQKLENENDAFRAALVRILDYADPEGTDVILAESRLLLTK